MTTNSKQLNKPYKDNSEQLNKLYKDYNLDRDKDFFSHSQGWTIIKRNGIDKVQAKAKIKITYDVIHLDDKFAVIKASGQYGDAYIETFGEADRRSNCKNAYHVAMAEKRAMGRVVLKLAGFYEAGAYTEDEAPEFSKDVSDALAEKLYNKRK